MAGLPEAPNAVPWQLAVSRLHPRACSHRSLFVRQPPPPRPRARGQELHFLHRLVRCGSRVRQRTPRSLGRHFALPRGDGPALCARVERSGECLEAALQALHEGPSRQGTTRRVAKVRQRAIHERLGVDASPGGVRKLIVQPRRRRKMHGMQCHTPDSVTAMLSLQMTCEMGWQTWARAARVWGLAARAVSGTTSEGGRSSDGPR